MKRRNRDAVLSQRVPGAVVHEIPAELRTALIANTTALAAWQDITPLARNEFICWVLDAKQTSTRERRIRRTQEELEDGQRRPCCWPGCKHRDRNVSSEPDICSSAACDHLPLLNSAWLAWPRGGFEVACSRSGIRLRDAR
jgi:hypothetical protein